MNSWFLFILWSETQYFYSNCKLSTKSETDIKFTTVELIDVNRQVFSVWNELDGVRTTPTVIPLTKTKHPLFFLSMRINTIRSCYSERCYPHLWNFFYFLLQFFIHSLAKSTWADNFLLKYSYRTPHAAHTNHCHAICIDWTETCRFN